MSVSIVEKVFEFVQKGRLTVPGDKVVVGVSGGVDSLALLHILYELKSRLQIELVVAHLDHQLRPDESGQDLAFVRDGTRALGLPFFGAKEDVKAFSERESLSLEDAARRVRYAFFMRVADSVGATKVAVAHTREDQAETLLLRLLRGTGMEGLEAMRPFRPFGPYVLIRPFLEVSKLDLRNYLKEKNLAWREDSSNQDIFLTRNRIRRLLIPLLEKEFNPQILESLCKLSQVLVVDNEYLNGQTKKNFQDLVNAEGGTLTLSVDSFKTLDLAIQRRLIREMFWALRPLEDLSYRHVGDVLSFLTSSQSGRGISLPKGIEVWLEFNRIFMGPRRMRDILPSEEVQIPGQKVLMGKDVQLEIFVQHRSKAEFPGWTRSGLSLARVWSSLSGGQTIECCEYFDGDRIRNPFIVRSRQSGDLYDPMGLGCFKKVKKIFVDEKVPLRFRDQAPLFVSEGKIFWIGGYRISDSFKVRPQTHQVLEVRLAISVRS